MEVKSDPTKYETIQVIDLDIAFPGHLETYMLRPEDTLTVDQTEQTITLVFATGGTMTFNLKHAHYYASRTRSLKQVVPEPKEPKE